MRQLGGRMQRSRRTAIGLVSTAILLDSCNANADDASSTASCALKIYVYDLPWPFDDTKDPPSGLTDKLLLKLAALQEQAIQLAMRRGGGFIIPNTTSPVPPEVPCGLKHANADAAYLSSSNSFLEVIQYRLSQFKCTTTNASEASLFVVPLLMRTKSSQFYEDACNVLAKYTGNYRELLPHLVHLNAANADRHLFLKSSYKGTCPGWWSKPISKLQPAKRAISALLPFDAANGVVGVPYPSVVSLTERPWSIHRNHRPHLMAFTGKLHGSAETVALRRRLNDVCLSSRHCFRPGTNNCSDSFWSAYESAAYCLQPIGDTCERKGIIDGMLVGCIPVLFHECQLSLWEMHWGGWRAASSVFIDGKALVNGSVDVEKALRAIPASELKRMQEVIRANAWRMVYSAVDTQQGDAISIMFEALAKAPSVHSTALTTAADARKPAASAATKSPASRTEHDFTTSAAKEF